MVLYESSDLVQTLFVRQILKIEKELVHSVLRPDEAEDRFLSNSRMCRKEYSLVTGEFKDNSIRQNNKWQ